MKDTERFADRVDNYVLYRPHYPQEIIPFLQEKIGLKKSSVIADIGSGTGISSELFLQNGNTVYGVEPNKEMREAAEKRFKSDKHFISVNGSAEATILPDKSIDVIVAGQAFHWFDQVKAKKEFQRVVVAGASLVLMWNDRNLESGFQQAYERMLVELAPDYKEVTYRNVDESAMREFFHPFPYYKKSFYNAQLFDFEGLKGRLLSCSYAPLEGDKLYRPITERLKQIYEEYEVDSRVAFEYNCNVYFGRI